MKTSEHDGFFLRVYEVVKQIPPGRVSSYGAIARSCGSPGAARMVGWALNQCQSHSEYVPAHRVLNRVGLLTGKRHFQGRDLMRELLENEGVQIIENQVVNFQEIFWDPVKELGL